VAIVLLESPHPGQASESTTDLVSVQHSKVNVSDRQVLVAPELVTEHQTVSRAVHGFDTEALVLALEQEEILFVLGVVAAGLPQLQVEDVWSHDFLVASYSVLLPDEIHELVVQPGSFGIEEGATWTEDIHVKETLLLSNDPVVSFGRLL